MSKIFEVVIVLVGLIYVGSAVYILNSLPEMIHHSKSRLEKNQLQQEIRDAYNSATEY